MGILFPKQAHPALEKMILEPILYSKKVRVNMTVKAWISI